MTNQEKIAALQDNKTFEAELAAAASVEEAQEVLKRYGVEMTLEEVSAMVKEPEGELSAEDLEEVAGGCGCLRRIRGFKIIWVRMPPRWIPVPIMVPIYC